MPDAALIATLTAPPSPDGEEIRALPKAVRWVEVRADLTGDLDPNWLRSRFCGGLIYTLRSFDQGGGFRGSQEQRRARLHRAAQGYDLVDLEGQRDLCPECLVLLPPQKRVISWCGSATDEAGLCTRFNTMSAVQAQLYRLVSSTTKASDGLASLSFLKTLGRSDTTAFAIGPSGVWTQVIAPRLGAPIAFGIVGEDPCDSGCFTVSQLIKDYGFPGLGPVEEVFGILGQAVHRSLSPRLHNAAHRALGRRALYLPFQAQAEAFDDFYRKMIQSPALGSLGMSLRGLTVVSPHKETAMTATTQKSPIACRADTANILLRTNGSWTADTTDPAGVMVPLLRRGVRVASTRAAVVGCGGAGRAIAAVLKQFGARVTLVNRGESRGRYAARLLDLPFVSLLEFTAQGFSIVVNATPVGGKQGEQLFDLDGLSKDTVVIDLVYGDTPTELISNALALGLMPVDGREVLRIQTHRQFRMMTNRAMPAEVADEVLGKEQGFFGCPSPVRAYGIC